MQEGDPAVSDQLEAICRANAQLENLILLRKQWTHEDLRTLGDCEHPDIVLFGYDPISSMPDEQKEAQRYGDRVSFDPRLMPSEIIRRLGDHILYPNKEGRCEYLAAGRDRLVRLHWFYPFFTNHHAITSTFGKKELTKTTYGKTVTTEWVPGINFVTFKRNGGTVPTGDQLIKLLTQERDNEDAKADEDKHKDWMPGNLIVQDGQGITFVDDQSFSKCGKAKMPCKENLYVNMYRIMCMPGEVSEKDMCRWGGMDRRISAMWYALRQGK